MRNVKVASVQFNHRANDKFHNLNTIHAYARQASAQGVDFLCFPEMCITGFRHLRNLKRRTIVRLAEKVPAGLSCHFLQDQAQRYGINIGAGLIEEGDDGRLYNTYVIAMNDGRIERHRKSCTPGSEHMSHENDRHVFETPAGCRTGVLTCEESSQAGNVEETARYGADIILVPHLNGKAIVLDSRGEVLTETSGKPDALEVTELKMR